jgi:membrane protein implicated in regulation of membrane protease activity
MLRDGGDSSEKSMLTGLGGICATAVAASFTSTQSAAVDAVFIAVSILTFILVIYFWARARKTRLLRDKIITRISAQGDNVSPLGNDDGHV